MRWRIHSIFLTAAICALAQNSAPPNPNAPIRLRFVCAEEDLAAVGMSCTDENPCPVYLELTGVSSQAKRLAVTGNLHGSSTTLYSVLLSSDDGGADWKEAAARVPGAALDQVQLLDAQHGWAAGEVQVPLSRDPFFLITSDAGATWRKRALTEEGGPGDVQRFWFDTPDHGELIVDAGRSAEGGRYQMYETRTGGDSWNILSKTTQAPRLRRAPAVGEINYRIGTDSKSKTYVIERRDGETWMRVASFLVQAASCGAPPPPPPPPPEPPTPAPDPAADVK